jgi:hypothetical protein
VRLLHASSEVATRSVAGSKRCSRTSFSSPSDLREIKAARMSYRPQHKQELRRKAPPKRISLLTAAVRLACEVAERHGTPWQWSSVCGTRPSVRGWGGWRVSPPPVRSAPRGWLKAEIFTLPYGSQLNWLLAGQS